MITLNKEGVEIEIEAVKIIGKIKGTSETLELLMDSKDFYEWKKFIKEAKE